MFCNKKLELNLRNVLLLAAIVIIISVYIFFALTISENNNFLSKIFKGNDFEYLYKGSLELRTGNPEKIYDINFYKGFLEDNKTVKILNPNYPPILYYIYLPFSLLPYYYSVLSTTIFHIFLYIASVILLILTFKRLYQYSLLIILFAVIFPPFIFVIFNGHPSVLWLFIFSLSFYLAKKNMLFYAGLALSLLLLNPGIFILVFIILLFSFRMKTFSGLLSGSLLLFAVTGVIDNFRLWAHWFDIIKYLSRDVFNKETLMHFGEFSNRMFFYPMTAKLKILSILEYSFVIAGLLALIFPIIYSYNQKKTFSRNSYWFILPISIVLASPYLYNYDLVILLLPIIIFFNLMLADRVLTKYIVLTITVFTLGVALCFAISIFFHIQPLAVLLWFFLINGALGKRIRNFTPNNFIEYWDNY